MKQLFLVILTAASSYGFSQERTSSSGGEAVGAGGTVSYSIGIIDHSSVSAAGGSVSQGLQQTYISEVGVNEWDLSIDISVFPNPSSDRVTIKLPENASDFTYVLTDMNGKLVRKGYLIENENQLEISSLEEAMYFLNILSSDVSVRSFKITKN